MKFSDLPVDAVFCFSDDSELSIGKAKFQKYDETTAILSDEIAIEPDTEVELAS